MNTTGAEFRVSVSTMNNTISSQAITPSSYNVSNVINNSGSSITLNGAYASIIVSNNTSQIGSSMVMSRGNMHITALSGIQMNATLDNTSRSGINVGSLYNHDGIIDIDTNEGGNRQSLMHMSGGDIRLASTSSLTLERLSWDNHPINYKVEFGRDEIKSSMVNVSTNYRNYVKFDPSNFTMGISNVTINGGENDKGERDIIFSTSNEETCISSKKIYLNSYSLYARGRRIASIDWMSTASNARIESYIKDKYSYDGLTLSGSGNTIPVSGLVHIGSNWYAVVAIILGSVDKVVYISSSGSLQTVACNTAGCLTLFD